MDKLTPYQFDIALQEPVFVMEQRGIRVDFDRLIEHREELYGKWNKWQEDLNRLTGRDLNVNSSKQVGEFLFDVLNLPGRKVKGKISTSEDKLRALLADCKSKLEKLTQESARQRWYIGAVSIILILKIRGVRKAISSYIDIEFDQDGRARTNLSVGKTETGRFSSSKTLWGTGLNLQTVPKKLRDCYIADEGLEMAELDLNRGESWVYAHLSKDYELMEIHHNGLDFHAETASVLSFEFLKDHITPEEIALRAKSGDKDAFRLRYLGKKVNHASAYKMGPFRQAEVINEEADDTGITITVGQAKKAQELWRGKYPGMVEWWNTIIRDLSTDRTLTTPYGRRRTFFSWWGNELFKEATAYVPQSTSVDYLNRGLLRVYNELVKLDFHSLEILHQNHDAILIQYDPAHRDEVLAEVSLRLVSSLVIHDVEFSIPVEAEYGPDWLNLREWKE